MKILVLGAGAVGGYFGGRLAKLSSSSGTAAACDVTFLVRPRREEQLQQDGLQIDDASKDDNDNHEIERISPIQTITNNACKDGCDEPPQFDVILLTCKAYSLSGALDALAPFVTTSTCILPLLNGMAHIQLIQDRFPDAIVWGGTCGIVATLTSEGVVKKMTESQFIRAGVRKQDDNPTLLNELVSLMKEAGIEATVFENIMVKMWEKWTFLTTLAASTCLLDGTIGEILATDHGATYIKGVYDECNLVATAAVGEEMKFDAEQQTKTFRRVLGDPNSIIKASMARDLQAGGPTEADHILGDMIARAKELWIATPLLSIAYARLQVYENQRKLDNNND